VSGFEAVIARQSGAIDQPDQGMAIDSRQHSLQHAQRGLKAEGNSIRQCAKQGGRGIGKLLLGILAVLVGLFASGLQAAVVELGPEIEMLSERPDELKVFLSQPEFTDLYQEATGSGRWLKINTQKHVDRGNHWTLMVRSHAYNRVDVFLPHDENGYLIFNTGHLGHNRARLMYMYRAVPLNYKVETQPIYIWSEDTRRHPLTLSLWTRDELPDYDSTANLVIGIYLGVLIAMLIYNGFIYIALLDRTCLYYLFLATALLLFLGVDTGYFNNRMTTLHTWLGSYVSIISVALINLSTIAFARSFLAARKDLPRLYKLLDLLVWAFLALLLAALFSLEPLRVAAYTTINLLTVTNMIALLCLALLALKAGYRSAIYFSVAWALVTVLVIIRILGVEDVITQSLYSQIGVYPASGFGMLLLSLGLIDQLGRKRGEQERLAIEAQLKANPAITDNLTGMFGRRQILQVARDMFVKSRKLANNCSVMMINIDGFGAINEQCGRGIGDTVLLEITHACKVTLRGSDLVGRMGADEFMAALPGTGLEKGAVIAERLRQKIQTTHIEGTDLSVTVCIGVAAMSDTDVLFQDLVDRADRVLSQARQEGKNQVKTVTN
jgi:diguanylate cyclase (GGDEF)-like protein